jgi:predicted Zn-dependent protease
MINGLEPPDSHHLNAAEGWLGLGNTAEAREELAKLSLGVLSHPEVLRVKYHVYEKGKQWERATDTAQLLCQVIPESPFGWIHLAYALHELKRTSEAFNVLISVADQFPEEYVIRYNLACYCCQMGRLGEARVWLKKAVALIGSDTIKEMAASDPDLEMMKEDIRQF